MMTSKILTPEREEILRLVREQPGLMTRDIQRRVAVGRQSADYHLHRLRKAGLIVSRKMGRTLRHFANGHGLSEGALRWTALGEVARGVLVLVSRNPESTVLELARWASIRPRVARAALKEARRWGLVECQWGLRRFQYRLTALGKEAVESREQGDLAPFKGVA